MDILRGILLYLKRDKLKWRGMSDERTMLMKMTRGGQLSQL